MGVGTFLLWLLIWNRGGYDEHLPNILKKHPEKHIKEGEMEDEGTDIFTGFANSTLLKIEDDILRTVIKKALHEIVLNQKYRSCAINDHGYRYALYQYIMATCSIAEIITENMKVLPKVDKDIILATCLLYSIGRNYDRDDQFIGAEYVRELSRSYGQNDKIDDTILAIERQGGELVTMNEQIVRIASKIASRSH